MKHLGDLVTEAAARCKARRPRHQTSWTIPKKAILLRNKMTSHPCHGEQNYYLASCKFAYIGEIKPAVSG